MTLQNAISEADLMLPNGISSDMKTVWVDRLDLLARRLVMKDNGDTAAPADGAEQRILAIPDPFSAVYPLYIQCMVYLSLGEFDRYDSLMTLFNSQWEEYARWYQRTGGR